MGRRGRAARARSRWWWPARRLTAAARPDDDTLRAAVAERESAGLSRRDAITEVATEYGLRRREVYAVVPADAAGPVTRGGQEAHGAAAVPATRVRRSDGVAAASSAATPGRLLIRRHAGRSLGLLVMSHVLAAVAWPYANGPRHIGHVSGFGVPSDVFARYMRMAGHDVLMVSGTDEHGTPIQVQADAEGVTPRELADRYNRVIVEDLHGLGLSYDLFTRTTTRNHYAVVQELFEGMYRNGYIVPKTTMGAISPSTGRTLPDRYIEGTCPICGYDSARGDQCDNCGNQLDPIDLINPRSKINGETPEFVETEHFFLDLPALADVLRQWLDTREGWRPNVLRFSRNLLDDLQPRAITRDLEWGVPIPLDGWRDRPDKRIYVWFDAVIGYLSASIEWARRSGDPEAWRKWWSTDGEGKDAPGYYFMGKDNIVFHSVIWPALLLGYSGEGSRDGEPGQLGRLNLPDRGGLQRVPDHGGAQVLLVPHRSSSTSGTSWSATTPTRCATSSPSPARRATTPTSPGPSSSAATTTSWSPAGATWSTGPSRWRRRTSARSRRSTRPGSPRPTRRCSPPPGPASPPSAT